MVVDLRKMHRRPRGLTDEGFARAECCKSYANSGHTPADIA